MKDISPKKYIETRVRSLPIYKCLINKDWENAKMVNVIVMRKHVNGKLTAGIYLIDLLCLGVKDAMFIFNEPEDKILEGFGDHKDYLMEVGYDLAHNIVYAGHDFAMEYDIEPHPDFKTARFILEEDDDTIPLIEIPVGDDEGLPSLILQPGQSIKYRHVIEKLEKKLGRDNFNFYEGEEEDVDDDEYEDELSENIEDYEIGSINPFNVQFIDLKDLMDVNKTHGRGGFELATIEVELKLRMLRISNSDLFNELPVEEREEFSDIEDAPFFSENITEEMEREMEAVLEEELAYTGQISEEEFNDNDKNEARIIKTLKEYAHNPIVVANLLENAVFFNSKGAIEQIKVVAKRMALQYPVIKLSLALCTTVLKESDTTLAYILKGKNLHVIFPIVKTFGLFELQSFWLMKAFYGLQNDNLKEAIYYYELIAELELQSSLLFRIQDLLVEKMDTIFQER